MRKINPENERLKTRYLNYRQDVKGMDEKTRDKELVALLKFEESTNFKPFKKFNIEQARRFKVYLSKAKSQRTGSPLSLSTIDATLRAVKGFFEWLASQQGFKKVVTYDEVEYFNNNLKDRRAAHAHRHVEVPSRKAAFHVFDGMPNHTVIQRRNKAIYALIMLTGARDGAVASFRLKHVNLVDGYVFQDGREVNTKASKTFKTTFFPVEPEYLECLTGWVNFLRDKLLYGQNDALFPKPERTLIDGKFTYDTLSREPYSTGAKINEIIKNAFAEAQLPPCTPHSFRKTLVQLMNDLELPLEVQKAWSQNLGHENFTTTVSAYLPVSELRQAELIRSLERVHGSKSSK